MNEFRRHMAAFPNVRLYVAELAYGDRPHEVTGMDYDAANIPAQERLWHHLDIPLRTDQILWHKENLINAVVSRFPPNWEYGAWLDADMVCTRHDWALETIHLLQQYHLVQLFSSYIDVTGDHQPYGMARSFAWNFHHQEEFLQQRSGNGGASGMSMGSFHSGAFPAQGRSDLKAGMFPFGYDPGAPGGGWGFTRKAFDLMGGMLDVNILGGGDSEMAHGLIGAVKPLADRVLAPTAKDSPRAENSGTVSHAAAIVRWQQNAQKLEQRIGYVDQCLMHHFHGSKTRRFYYNRWKILRDYDYNPFTDLVRDWQGVWRWAGNKPALEAAVAKYFLERKEDDPNLYGKERPLL